MLMVAFRFLEFGNVYSVQNLCVPVSYLKPRINTVNKAYNIIVLSAIL